MALIPRDENGKGSPLNLLNFVAPSEGKTRKWINIGLTGLAAYETLKAFQKRHQVQNYYIINLPEGDTIYDDVQLWLIDSIPAEKRRSVMARSGKKYDDYGDPISPKGKRVEATLNLYYDGKTSQKVWLGGHEIEVGVSSEQENVNSGGTATIIRRHNYITFTCKSQEAARAVSDFLHELSEKRLAASPSTLYLAGRWGDWNSCDLPHRPLETVVLRDGQKEELVDDIAEFLDSEVSYNRHGIPWHRGYIFHGPPGTGKTSLAKVLAQHFEMDIFYIPLGDISNDTDLLKMFVRVTQNSFLVLEDIDVVNATRSRDKESKSKSSSSDEKGISLSGLLNALDGLASPHGVITVMTTNYLDKLDPALIRPGRADRIEKLDYLDGDQFARLSKVLTGREVDWEPTRDVTHAEVVEIAKRHLRDSDAAYKAVSRWAMEQ